MRTTNRYLSLLGTIAAAAGLAACGGGGSSEVVAQVAGVGSITEAALAHWTAVEAVLVYQQTPRGPVPKGVVPDPPNYTACVAYLRSTGEKLVESGPQPTTSQLKGKCEQRLQELKTDVLNNLISWDWTIGEGAALGMRVSDADARARLAEVNGRLFRRSSEFRVYLEQTGQSVADMLLRSKVQLFEVKESERLAALEKRLPAKLTAQQRLTALRTLITSVRPQKQWVARTSCRAGFVISDCRQYKGPLSPG
jgi:hypothetical protein